jgi:hypothetical protein
MRFETDSPVWPPFRIRGAINLLLAAVVLCVLAWLEWRHFNRGILGERPPILDGLHFARSVAIMVAAVLSFHGLQSLLEPLKEVTPPVVPPWPKTTAGLWLAGGLPLVCALCFTVIFALDPRLFYLCVKEDYPVEMLSALLALCASLCLFRVWLSQRKMRLSAPLPARVYVFLFATSCLLLAGEEVSWLQRQIGYGTPESFSGNLQHEFNFHNFETDRVEAAYYVWAFGMTVFAAFLRECVPSLSGLQWLHNLLPGRHAAYAGALAAGWSYENWNTIPAQMVFFMSLCILLGFVLRPEVASGGRLLPLAVLLIVIAGQLLVLAHGHSMVRAWDSSELKELLMPMSFMLCALELHARYRGGMPESGFNR